MVRDDDEPLTWPSTEPELGLSTPTSLDLGLPEKNSVLPSSRRVKDEINFSSPVPQEVLDKIPASDRLTADCHHPIPDPKPGLFGGRFWIDLTDHGAGMTLGYAHAWLARPRSLLVDAKRVYGQTSDSSFLNDISAVAVAAVAATNDLASDGSAGLPPTTALTIAGEEHRQPGESNAPSEQRRASPLAPPSEQTSDHTSLTSCRLPHGATFSSFFARC